jgi:hypothetical protein
MEVNSFIFVTTRVNYGDRQACGMHSDSSSSVDS